MQNVYAEHPPLALMGKAVSAFIVGVGLFRGSIESSSHGMIAEFFLASGLYCFSKTLERNNYKNTYMMLAIIAMILNRLVDTEYFLPRETFTP